MSEKTSEDFTEDFPTELQHKIESINERYACILFEEHTLLVMDEEEGEIVRVTGENMTFEEPKDDADE